MQRFEFTSEELEILREVLERELRQLELEVFHSDTHEFKELLKHRKAVLEEILAKFPAIPVL